MLLGASRLYLSSHKFRDTTTEGVGREALAPVATWHGAIQGFSYSASFTLTIGLRIQEKDYSERLMANPLTRSRRHKRYIYKIYCCVVHRVFPILLVVLFAPAVVLGQEMVFFDDFDTRINLTKWKVDEWGGGRITTRNGSAFVNMSDQTQAGMRTEAILKIKGQAWT